MDLIMVKKDIGQIIKDLIILSGLVDELPNVSYQEYTTISTKALFHAKITIPSITEYLYENYIEGGEE